MFYGGSMEAIEYEKRNTVNKRMKNGVLGYTLGLIGSILSGNFTILHLIYQF